jgi:quinol monooxygenase YgiN
MEVDPDKIEPFKRFMGILSEEKQKMEGCVHHDFFSDKQYVNVYYSYTIWESQTYLKKYKKNPLFKEVTKTLTSLCLAEPHAWTVENVFNTSSGHEE